MSAPPLAAVCRLCCTAVRIGHASTWHAMRSCCTVLHECSDAAACCSFCCCASDRAAAAAAGGTY